MGNDNNGSDDSNLPSMIGQTFLSDSRIEQTKMSVLPLCPELTVTYYFDTTK